MNDPTELEQTETPPVPTRADVARSVAWQTFGAAVKATPAATPSDRLRRYAEACQIAGEAYHDIRTFGDDAD